MPDPSTPHPPPPKAARLTLAIAGVTLLALAISVPGSLREAIDRGSFYVFSREFIDDLPLMLTGPGNFRFVLQPTVAILLGIRNGLADARAGRLPYLLALATDRQNRRALMREGLLTVANVLLMGILLDAIIQWLTLGTSHPGRALIVGPVLIVAPYSIARALSNRIARRRP